MSHRYKICFIENLVEYFSTLAEAESAWNDAYDAARSRYIEVRDSYADIPDQPERCRRVPWAMP